MGLMTELFVANDAEAKTYGNTSGKPFDRTQLGGLTSLEFLTLTFDGSSVARYANFRHDAVAEPDKQPPRIETVRTEPVAKVPTLEIRRIGLRTQNGFHVGSLHLLNSLFDVIEHVNACLVRSVKRRGEPATGIEGLLLGVRSTRTRQQDESNDQRRDSAWKRAHGNRNASHVTRVSTHESLIRKVQRRGGVERSIRQENTRVVAVEERNFTSIRVQSPGR